MLLLLRECFQFSKSGFGSLVLSRKFLAGHSNSMTVMITLAQTESRTGKGKLSPLYRREKNGPRLTSSCGWLFLNSGGPGLWARRPEARTWAASRGPGAVRNTVAKPHHLAELYRLRIRWVKTPTWEGGEGGSMCEVPDTASVLNGVCAAPWFIFFLNDDFKGGQAKGLAHPLPGVLPGLGPRGLHQPRVRPESDHQIPDSVVLPWTVSTTDCAFFFFFFCKLTHFSSTFSMHLSIKEGCTYTAY